MTRFAAETFDPASPPTSARYRAAMAAASSGLDHQGADWPSDPSTAADASSATSSANARPCRPKPSPTRQSAPPAPHSPAPGPARAARVPHEKDAITDWAWAHSSRQPPKSRNPLPADRSASVAFPPTRWAVTSQLSIAKSGVGQEDPAFDPDFLEQLSAGCIVTLTQNPGPHG